MNALVEFSPFAKEADKVLAARWATIGLSAMTETARRAPAAREPRRTPAE